MSKKRTHSRSGSHSKSKRNQNKRSLRWLWVGLGFILLVVAGYWLLTNNSTPPAEISATQAYEKYQQGAFILDVRSQEEWDQAHIPNSTLIPLGGLQGRLSELPRDQDIVVVCLSGQRSKEGMTLLRQAGFSRASCMTGGLAAWKAAGYSLEGSAL